MNRIVSNISIAALAMTVTLAANTTQAGTYHTPTSFVEPTAWNVGDANTTYQEWDILTSAIGTTPDVGHTVNPAISSTPDLSVVDIDSETLGTGFVSGSANYYSFSQHYGIGADIYNHGGPSGAGGLPAGSGTYVIVQAGLSLNGGTGFFPGTLQIVDPNGDPIAGGDNASAIQQSNLYFGTGIPSPFGPVDYSEDLWEFFLPNYVGDFRVRGDIIVHSSFDVLRVDSAIISPGDVTLDRSVDGADVDALFAEDGNSAATAGLQFDLVADGTIIATPNTTDSDIDELVRNVLGTEYGDSNLDQIVNPTDLADLTLNWLGTGKGWADGDFNGDTIVNPTDLASLTLNWLFDNSTGPVETTSVPEPSSLILLGAAAVGVLSRRRRA